MVQKQVQEKFSRKIRFTSYKTAHLLKDIELQREDGNKKG